VKTRGAGSKFTKLLNAEILWHQRILEEAGAAILLRMDL
jgi:hypothetical protein